MGRQPPRRTLLPLLGPGAGALLAAFKTVFRDLVGGGRRGRGFRARHAPARRGRSFLERAARRLFPGLPLIAGDRRHRVFGLGNPTLYNLARPAVYESAIVGGQAFLLLGLVFAFDAVCELRVRPRGLIAAAACLGGRHRLPHQPRSGGRGHDGPDLAGAGAAEAGPLAAPAARRRCGWALPALLGLFVLLAYNRLRFGAWLDFGRQHQLNWIDMRAGRAFVPPNLYAYLRRPPVWSCRFPFAYAIMDMGLRAFPPRSMLPPGYFVYEQVAGILPTFPWSWLGAAGAGRGACARSGGRAPCRRSAGRWRRPRSGATAALAPLLFLSTATNRYLGDVVGLLALLGALGAFALVEALRERPVGPPTDRRRGARVGGRHGRAWGSRSGSRGNTPTSRPTTRALYDKLVHHLSLCHGQIPPEPK